MFLSNKLATAELLRVEDAIPEITLEGSVSLLLIDSTVGRTNFLPLSKSIDLFNLSVDSLALSKDLETESTSPIILPLLKLVKSSISPLNAFTAPCVFSSSSPTSFVGNLPSGFAFL